VHKFDVLIFIENEFESLHYTSSAGRAAVAVDGDILQYNLIEGIYYHLSSHTRAKKLGR
jgi:hypothetical protein